MASRLVSGWDVPMAYACSPTQKMSNYGQIGLRLSGIDFAFNGTCMPWSVISGDLEGEGHSIIPRRLKY